MHAAVTPNARRMTYKLALLLVIGWNSWLVSGEAASAQSLSTFNIFGSAVPSQSTVAYAKPVTVGVKFWSSESGWIEAIRFYRGTVSPGGYIASLYSASGRLLGSVTMAQESGPVPGWQVAQLASPIPIAANRTYVAAYYTASGQYAKTPQGLLHGETTGPLHASASATVGGNGVYLNKDGFPSLVNVASNYFVDVLFATTDVQPYLVLSFNPANPTVAANASAGIVVAAITAQWSDGSPFAGTLSFGTPYSNDNATFAISGNNLIVNPEGPGLSSDGGQIQNVTIVATQ
jgi:hypothetical protein